MNTRSKKILMSALATVVAVAAGWRLAADAPAPGLVAAPAHAQAAKAPISKTQALIDANREALYEDDRSPIAGNPDGDVTLVEFFDYNCPYCRKMSPRLGALIERDSGLKMVYKEFPVLTPSSGYAARAALAAHRQGRYIELHEALMAASGVLKEEQVLEIAGATGLDVARLQQDMADPAIQEAIDDNLALAQELGLYATPSLVVDGRIFKGLVEIADVEGLIAEMRAVEGGAQ